MRSVMRLWIGGIWLSLAATGGLFAQVSPPDERGSEQTIATDPIRCWWKSGKSAVFLGEQFPLTLTCRVVDTPAIRVVADQSRLDPMAVQLPPFDVVGGTRHPDVQAGSRRFFQYQYSLRVIGDDLFGRDITVPMLDIHYRIESAIDEDAATEGREQVYRVPALPVRVLSLVSAQAIDIRDAPVETFAEIQSGRFRANVAFTIAALLFSAGFGLLAVAAFGVIRQYRTPATPAARLLSQDAILRSARHALHTLQRDVEREGWNRDLIGRTLAVVRLGCAIALGRQPAQVAVNDEPRNQDGALVVRRGLFRPERLMVSASGNADELNQERERHSGAQHVAAVQGQTPALLGDFRSVLDVFTIARYGRQDNLDRADLDRALADAVGALRQLRTNRSWLSRTSNAISGLMARGRAWVR